MKTQPLKWILVAGARPNFMKIAPLMRAINKYNHEHRTLKIEPTLIHTGQHYDLNMSDSFLSDLSLPEPDVHLGVGSGTHAEQTGKVMIEFESLLSEEKSDLIDFLEEIGRDLLKN